MKQCSTAIPRRRLAATIATALAMAAIGVTSLSSSSAAQAQAIVPTVAGPTITSFVCPNNADSGNGWFACYATYSSSTPATGTWTGRQGYQYDGGNWTDFMGPCAFGETVKITLTVRNAYGTATRNASFKCRW
ncbi:MAG: hypothetical protein KA144_06760 [Xanthomonadaceae bacterium]|nr:hypothetical protein [Xanthomonadaceae bacterium]